MATMNVSLPGKLKEWVEERAAGGTYANASDYVRDLIRNDQRRENALRELRGEIQKGIDSGISPLTQDEVFERAHRAVDAAAKRRAGGAKKRVLANNG